jgi:hypothetical protein
VGSSDSESGSRRSPLGLMMPASRGSAAIASSGEDVLASLDCDEDEGEGLDGIGAADCCEGADEPQNDDHDDVVVDEVVDEGEDGDGDAVVVVVDVEGWGAGGVRLLLLPPPNSSRICAMNLAISGSP